MRKIILNKQLILWVLTALMVSVLSAAPAAQVIENPGTPPAKKAGRQIKITEVLRIADEGGDFYFKSPYRLKIAPDGSIFVVDDKQFLKFNKEGKFIANLQKTGEGPGEYTHLRGFQVMDNRLIINTSQPPKLLVCDLSGHLIKEYRLNEKMGFQRVLGIFDDKYYYIHAAVDLDKTKSGIRTFHQYLYASTFDDQNTDLKLDLPLRWVVEKIATKEGGIVIRIRAMDNLCFVLENEHSLYVSHTSAYLIKQVDLANGKIIRQFTRKYTPVPFVPEKPDKNSRPIEGFKKEYFSDVSGLSLYNGKLWVFTSTLDKQKGVLVDLFSLEGQYLDYFYLPLPGFERPDTLEQRSYTIDGQYLYIVEPDAEETPTIVKYKLEIY